MCVCGGGGGWGRGGGGGVVEARINSKVHVIMHKQPSGAFNNGLHIFLQDNPKKRLLFLCSEAKAALQ